MSKKKIQTGVYTIRCLINDKLYVGSTSVSFKRRKNHHFNELKRNNHGNPHLQNSYNKYGKESFYFQVEERIEDYDEMLKREQDWIDFYWNFEILYNINRYVVSSPMKGRAQSKEARQKISDANRGENHYNYGRTLSDETKEKISKSLTGVKLSNERKQNISKRMSGENHYNYGGTLSNEHRQKIAKAKKGQLASDETKRKMSESHKGKKHWNYGNKFPPNRKRVAQIDIITNEPVAIHDSITGAARKLGLKTYTGISDVLKGRKKSSGGFFWEYVSKQ